MRVFQVSYCEDKYERRVADALLELYERLHEEHPEYRFDFIQTGAMMGTSREES